MIKYSKNGFSLVELMVTIVIIGVLSLIAIPSYKNYVADSKTAEAYSTINGIAKSQFTFYSEYRYFMSLQRNPEGFPETKTWNNDVVGWGTSWGGPYPGTVMADGSQMNFTFAAEAGNQSGKIDLTQWSGSSWDFSSWTSLAPLDEPFKNIFVEGRASQSCLGYDTSTGTEFADSFTADSLGATGSGNYIWGILAAQGNIFGNETCRYIFGVIEARNDVNGGTAGFKKGFISVDHDYSQ